MKILLLIVTLLLCSCAVQQKIYPPKINKAPHGWTVYEWQSVIDCSFKEGKGSDWDCDSCYLLYCKKYYIAVDTAILNYY